MCPNNEFTVTRRSLLAFLMPQWHSMTFLITPMFLTGLCVTGWSLLANHMVSFISNEIKKVQIKNSKQILEQYKHNKNSNSTLCYMFYLHGQMEKQTDRQTDGRMDSDSDLLWLVLTFSDWTFSKSDIWHLA